MTRSTPTIRDETLLSAEAGQEVSIAVGSAQWFAWLGKETSTIFAFHSSHGSYTARKEGAGNHRGGWYWKAYRKYNGTLYRAYLGKPQDLTLARLNDTALALAARTQEPAAPDVSVTNREAQPQTKWDTARPPLLETKLHPPRLPALLVERTRLLALLDAGQSQKLTLLQAPAGFGKTTLVSQWIAHRQANAPVSVAWVSLDSGDNDPVRFWSSIMSALQNFQAHLGQKALTQLSQVSRIPFAASPLETVLTLLLNDLARSEKSGVLVLEDYHLIEHVRIHETLTFFIEHLPATLHVIILTRSEPPLPLVRWRARGDILEIPQSQLRFSADETAAFAQQVIPQTLSQEAIGSLHNHLEGWAVGLRLLAFSLQGQMTAQAIEAILSQLHTGAGDRTHRFIHAFFLSEVLATQPEQLQLFMLQTSILRRLSGPLCDAITGRQNSAEWLELALRSGFFLEALDSGEGWYRYHALFADTLRTEAKARLGEEALRNLSALASRWYEEHVMLIEAIEAALAAREFERVAHLIEKLNESTYLTEYHTIRRWLECLPEPLLRTHPALCFLLAQARVFAEDSEGPLWRLEPVEELLHMAEEGWRKEENLFQVGLLYAFRATFTIVHGQQARAVMYARQALHLLPPAATQPYGKQNPRSADGIEWHCGSLLTLSIEAMQEGAFGKAYQLLRDAYNLSLNNPDRVFTRITGGMLGDICMEIAELHEADFYYRQTLLDFPLQDEKGDVIIRAGAMAGLIQLAYERNDLETAEKLIGETVVYKYRGEFLYGEEGAYTKIELMRLLLLYARGEVAAVHSSLSALLAHHHATPAHFLFVPDVLIRQARLQIREGDYEAAERTLQTLALSEKELGLLQQQTVRVIQARLLLAKGEAEAALPLLEQLLAGAQQGGHRMRVLEIQMLIALTYVALKQANTARRQLAHVLTQTRSEGFLRFFMDEGEPLETLLRQLLPFLNDKPLYVYAQNILHACTTSQPAHHSAETTRLLKEPLSPQEKRVLALLVAGHSNPEIAQELIISVNTVKGHVQNLYRKLDVNNRMQAGDVARREKLI